MPITSDDVWAKGETKKAENSTILEAVRLAKKCFENPDFKKYMDQVNKAEAECIEKILRLRMEDPIEYAFYVNRLVAELNVVRALKVDIVGKKGLSDE